MKNLFIKSCLLLFLAVQAFLVALLEFWIFPYTVVNSTAIDLIAIFVIVFTIFIAIWAWIFQINHYFLKNKQ